MSEAGGEGGELREDANACGCELRHEVLEAEVNGVSLHVEEQGLAAGPAVLLLHGFPELWLSWHQQMAALAARGFRALAPDLHGRRAPGPPPPPQVEVQEYHTDVVGIQLLHGRRRRAKSQRSGLCRAVPEENRTITTRRRYWARCPFSATAAVRSPLPSRVPALTPASTAPRARPLRSSLGDLGL